MCRHLHIYHRNRPPATESIPSDQGAETSPEYDDYDDNVNRCKVIFDRCEMARWGEDCGGSMVEEVIIEKGACQWCTKGALG